ncbi:bifunctional DNA primase/polymerase [Kitasatospora arboriphila]|uniref:Bifunctional DNA primase/polymerase n=1 Tax=Kitasatospora arboriphila TaxID=258052 RepID=A0ABN1TKT4_9ACTN
MPPTSNLRLADALAAAGRGHHVFPLAPDAKYPALHHKDRCPGTGACADGHLGWEQRATLDPDMIRRAWGHGPYGIGVACGPSGLLVVDLDTPKHPRDLPPPEAAGQGIADGMDVFAALCEQHRQPIPDQTFTVRTGRGGLHLYYALPAGVRLRNTTGDKRGGLGWKVDTRAAGGYVVAPGSTVGGRPYEVTVDLPPAPLPGWLLALLTPKAPATPPADVASIRARIGHLSAYNRAVLDREAAKVEEAGEGRRNTALFASAASVGRLVAAGTLPEADATNALLAAGRSIGLGESECLRTIRQGLARGAQGVSRAA